VLLRAVGHLLSYLSGKHRLGVFEDLLIAHLPDLVELAEIILCFENLFTALKKDALNFT
jgi:hypothetical protein